jgi:hypothetical protein
MAACAFMAGTTALAENKPAGPSKPAGKGASSPKDKGWYVPELDSDSSAMVKGKGAPKTPAARGSGRP